MPHTRRLSYTAANGSNLLEPTVNEDREKLDGASKGKVCKCFKEWVAETAKIGDGQGPKANQSPDGLLPCTARYQYCIYVDQESLDSCAPRKWSAERKPITPYVGIIRLDRSLPDLENFWLERRRLGSQRGWSIGWRISARWRLQLCCRPEIPGQELVYQLIYEEKEIIYT